MKIGRKIYYDKLTGNVILDTGERFGAVVETTIEQDFQAYRALSERNPETVDWIQLEYGQYAQDFATCNGYRVNPETLELEFSYPDPNEPEAPPVYRKPLSEEIAELKQRQELMQAALDELILGGAL
jgi:hypothetical protein